MFNNVLNFIQYGFGLETWFAYAVLFLNRVALGLFFTFSGYHKLFNRQRHATIVATLKQCGVPDVAVMQWFVPCVEFFGGLSLLSGIASPLAAVGLIAVCLVATLTDGLKRIPSERPIDKADYCDDVLYLPEVLYIFGLLIVLALGPGPVSVVSLFQ
jgi:putative oxidoreductase